MIALLAVGAFLIMKRRKRRAVAAAAASAVAAATAAAPPKPPADTIGRLALPETKTEPTGKTEQVDNLPNLVTLAGYGLGVWWCVGGGPSWAALASIGLDEVDGALARSRGEETSFGADLDAAADMTLSGLALQRVNAPAWTIPASTLAILAYRKTYGRPRFGSLRAAIMLYGVLKDELGEAEGEKA